MLDLDALSREVAAAGDGWMQRGVSGVTDDGKVWFRANRGWLDEDDLPASEYEGDGDDGHWLASEVADICPNLRDPVTVNALLGEGEAHWDATKTYWIATIGAGEAACPTRTHAICRAWIAARGSKTRATIRSSGRRGGTLR